MLNLLHKLKNLFRKKRGGIVSNSALDFIHKGDHLVIGNVTSIDMTPKRPYVFTNQQVIISHSNEKVIPIRRAVNQDVSRFMKHGRQNTMYRHAVRAHVNPDDEDIP